MGDNNLVENGNPIDLLFIISSVMSIQSYFLNMEQLTNQDMLDALEAQTADIKQEIAEINKKLEILLERQ